jgi:hypothetical protein
MNRAEEFIKNINRGRKAGSNSCNRLRTVYAKLRKEKRVSVDYKTFTDVLRTVGDLIWQKVYAGHSVAIPYLFNMEVLPNTHEFVRSVNWKRTLDWWKEDEDAFNDRLLVRNEPTRLMLKVRHSTFSRRRNMWYYSLLFDIRPVKQKVRDIETKYEL